MNTHEVLKAAKALIADPKDWVQGRPATGPKFEAPYCSVGAVAKVLRIYDGEINARKWDAASQMREAEARLGAVVPNGSIVGYNDRGGQSHDCVMAAFDAAIERTAPK